MNAIQNYISALFSSLPQTPEVLRLQAEMMENMEEKYQDLLRAGKSENEAVGIVLSGIGSAEDLKAELGISDEPAQPQADHNPFFAERAAFQKKFAIAIAAGVVLCICAIIAGAAADELFHSDGLTALLFFAPIAAAATIFVYFGIREDWYDKQYKAIRGTDAWEDDEKKKHSLSGLVSSILFPLATMLFLFLGFMFNLWHPGWIIFPVCGILVSAIEAVEAYRKGN